MIAIVYDEIQKLIKDGPGKDILEKSRKDFTTTYEQYVQLKNSSYWSGVAAFYYESGFDYMVDYGNALRTVKPDEIQAFAKNVFSQGNLIEIKMDPAK
jgi:zinc protease